ncbi:alpha-1,2-fucosyltransferase [Vibrio tritonius]|uniref:alpha-1,2-fucosyltransferase n=1 Tax=Vibrio tritonius TaxID=1435069 RepID=UPI000837F688|nr:alpha-1,2-fucosyltransferase [Vibrio tritonius]
MIISRINGGLGNQMFQYAIARSIAMHHSVDFKLDISSFEKNKQFGFRLNKLNAKIDIAKKEEIEKYKGSESKISKIIRRFPLLSDVIYPKLYREKERTVYDIDVFNSSSLYLDGYWQNEKYFNKIKNELYEEFMPKGNLDEKIIEYEREIRQCTAVSIHVRRGDYLNIPDIGVLDLNYYMSSVEYILSLFDNVKFFIFSNDISWCENNFNFIKNKVFISGSSSEIDDLYLMSLCDHNIIANSSFSWWGGWLNKNEDKVVISPKNWMKVNPKDHKWVPDTWLQFPN